MLQAVSVADAQIDVLGSTHVVGAIPRQAEQEERIMDRADFVAESTQKRLTHEEVFGALRRKIHAG